MGEADLRRYRYNKINITWADVMDDYILNKKQIAAGQKAFEGVYMCNSCFSSWLLLDNDMLIHCPDCGHNIFTREKGAEEGLFEKQPRKVLKN